MRQAHYLSLNSVHFHNEFKIRPWLFFFTHILIIVQFSMDSAMEQYIEILHTQKKDGKDNNVMNISLRSWIHDCIYLM